MIKPIISAFALAAVLSLAACGSKNNDSKDTGNEAGMEKSTMKGVQQMQASTMSDTLKWRGSIYTYSISRTPDMSRPIVTDEQGRRFADNRIEVALYRNGDADTVFKSTFYKSSFESYLTSDFRKGGVLEGLVFDKVTPAGVQFAVSICFPQSDLYIPLLVIVSADGKVSIQKDSTMDADSPDDMGD